MARPSRPWFRFYVEATSDRKIRRLTPTQRWLWVAILSAARQSPVPGELFVAEGVPMTRAELADYAGVKPREVDRAIPEMESLGMVGVNGDGSLCVSKWNDRQFESDDVTARTAKHRSLERSNNGHGNAPETETEAETERESRNGAASSRVASGPRRKRPLTEVPDTFELTDERLEWCRENCPGLDPVVATQEWLTACKSKDLRYVDWDATWKNAMRRAVRWHNTSGARR